MSSKILVKSYDLGFFTQLPVTVQRFKGGQMVWCNHAGAEDDTMAIELLNGALVEVVVQYCRCGAYRVEHLPNWEYV